MLLENKTAIVTGGSRGIGRAICVALAKEGANIVTCYAKGAAAAEETVAMCREYGVQAVAVQADVAVPGEVEALFAEALKITGTIEILVNNAGITRDGLLLRMSDDDFNQVIDTNLRGAFYCMRAASKLMMKKRYGRIVTISSVVGVSGNAGQVNYAASKAGVRNRWQKRFRYPEWDGRRMWQMQLHSWYPTRHPISQDRFCM